jgi:hypothetical protein
MPEVKSEQYEAGFTRGENSANYGEAYHGYSRDDFDAHRDEMWSSAPGYVSREEDRSKWDYERGFEDGWNSHFDGSEEA